jgi:DNA invertase Pin-like site-specific DNA recombinase
MMKRVAIYLRVSTLKGQNTDNQRLVLEEIAKKSDWEIVGIYEDKASGAKGKESRPAYKRLQEDATRRKFDMVAAWSIDRLGRSLQELVSFLNEIQALGIEMYLHQQAIDTSTPAGKLFFHMSSAFAEFERSIIVERVNAGLARAKADGKVLGRPKIGDKKEDEIRTMLKGGTGILKTAKTLGTGTGTVQRIKNAMIATA